MISCTYMRRKQDKPGWLFALPRRPLYWRKLMARGFMLYSTRNLQRVSRLYWVVMRPSSCPFLTPSMSESARHNCSVNLWPLAAKSYRKIAVVKYTQSTKICVFIIANTNSNCFNKILTFKVYNYNSHELFRCKGVLNFDNLTVIIKEI